MKKIAKKKTPSKPTAPTEARRMSGTVEKDGLRTRGFIKIEVVMCCTECGRSIRRGGGFGEVLLLEPDSFPNALDRFRDAMARARAQVLEIARAHRWEAFDDAPAGNPLCLRCVAAKVDPDLIGSVQSGDE